MLELTYTSCQRALLKEYFALPNNRMTYEQCEGYLFAIICSPDGIEAEQWLAFVSGQDEHITEEQVFALMALHYDISEQVFNEKFILPYQPSDFDSLHQWSQGFLIGVENFYSGLVNSELLGNELRQALVLATEQLGFFSLEFAQINQYCEVNAREVSEFCNEQHTLANDFAKNYAQLIETTAVASDLYNNEP